RPKRSGSHHSACPLRAKSDRRRSKCYPPLRAISDRTQRSKIRVYSITSSAIANRQRTSAPPRKRPFGHHHATRRSRLLPSPTLGERGNGSLTRLSVPARGSSAADLTTRYIPSRTPSLETDSVGKSHRAPTPGPDTVVAWHSCSCR